MSLAPRYFKDFALEAAKSADGKLAEDLCLLELKHISFAPTDYLLLMTANSTPHLNALRDVIEETLDGAGLFPIRRDGLGSVHWCVLDYGGMLIHIFDRESRELYSMERLWESARKVSLGGHEKKSSAPKPKKPVKKTRKKS